MRRDHERFFRERALAEEGKTVTAPVAPEPEKAEAPTQAEVRRFPSLVRTPESEERPLAHRTCVSCGQPLPEENQELLSSGE